MDHNPDFLGISRRQFGIFLIFYLIISKGSLWALDLQVSYEPFSLKQFNGASQSTYDSGAYVSGGRIQDSNNLLFHLISLRISQSWPLGYKNLFLDLKTGLSASPLPVRHQWIIPAMDSNFSGTAVVPQSYSGGYYWDSHSISYSLNNQERYLTEDTSLTYVPLLFRISRNFLFSREVMVSAGVNSGVYSFYLSTQRNKLSGNPSGLYVSSERSMVHFASTFGGDLAISVPFSVHTSVFLEFDANAIKNISNIDQSSDGFLEGYRFDGLRYNAKLGVSWKI